MGTVSSATMSPTTMSGEAQLKVYRQLERQRELLAEEGIVDEATIFTRLQAKHDELRHLYEARTDFKVPTVRFGRTEIQMPILTLGGMRMQETWTPAPDMTLEKINKHVQANFEAILKRAMSLGINHIETARNYGTSEVQYGEALKKYPRESYILQTKGPPKAVASEFRANLEKSFRELQLEEGGYLDLFSIHGMNRPEHLDWVFGPGGCWEVVEEYRKQGKIRFVGFSSHGSADVITSAIETGRFDYCNIHHHFIGSYVCTGTGPVGGTRSCIEAAKKHDMGVFIISPADKGGALYEPPKAFQKACAPLTPIAFNELFLWSYDLPIHTLVIGAARPEDFDEHVAAAMLYDKRTELVPPIEARLRKMVTDRMGSADFFDTWYKGLPDAYANKEGLAVGYLYWLWWITKCWGFHSYAVTRYQSLEASLKAWDDSKPSEENTKAFGWVAGVAYRPEREAQLREALQGHPKVDHIVAAFKEAHVLFADGGCVKRGAIPACDVDGTAGEAGVAGVPAAEWARAYDLQSDKPYCDRNR